MKEGIDYKQLCHKIITLWRDDNLHIQRFGQISQIWLLLYFITPVNPFTKSPPEAFLGTVLPASTGVCAPGHDFAYPKVLLEWFISMGFNEEIRLESTDIKLLPVPMVM